MFDDGFCFISGKGLPEISKTKVYGDNMSYFLYLSVPQYTAKKIRDAFDSSIKLVDVTETLIGKEVRGRQSWPVYVLMIGLDSVKLVGGRAISEKARRKQDKSELFISGMRSLMANEECVSATIFLHLMSGDIRSEKVILKDTRHIPLAEIAQSIRDIEEDVLYILDRDDV